MSDLDEARGVSVYTDPSARSRHPARLLVVGAALGVVVVVAGGYRVAGPAPRTPEDALRAAATGYDDVIVGHRPARDILAYVSAGCGEATREAALAAPALTRVVAPGVTGFEVVKVWVQGTAGTVSTLPTGPGAAAFRNILQTTDGPGAADPWKLEDGNWVKANC